MQCSIKHCLVRPTLFSPDGKEEKSAPAACPSLPGCTASKEKEPSKQHELIIIKGILCISELIAHTPTRECIPCLRTRNLLAEALGLQTVAGAARRGPLRSERRQQTTHKAKNKNQIKSNQIKSNEFVVLIGEGSAPPSQART